MDREADRGETCCRATRGPGCVWLLPSPRMSLHWMFSDSVAFLAAVITDPRSCVRKGFHSVHHGGEGTEAGAPGSGSHCSRTQKAERDGL